MVGLRKSIREPRSSGNVAQGPAAHAASRKLLEDEQRFVDSARSPIWIGEEKTIIGSDI
jgi:hypothetical protein